MTNNDDIVKGFVPPYMNDTLRLFYAELQKGETDYAGMLTRLAAIIDSKARAAEREKIEKPLIENALEEVYRELHNGVKNGKYSVNDLALGTRIIESIRKMCQAQYYIKSPKGYLTKRELENKARASTANHIFADLKKHDTGYGDIVLSKEELRELEKKYEVD